MITPAFFDQLTNKIPSRFENGQAPIDVISGGNDSRSTNNEKQYPPHNSTPPPAGPPAYNQNNNAGHDGNEVFEALYNFKPNGPTDLALHPGQRLIIVNKLNNEWWRGKDLETEKEGIFPANYVKPVNGGNNNYNNDKNSWDRQTYNAPPPSGPPSQPPFNNTYYPPPPQQYNNNYYQPPPQQAPYPPPSTNYYPPPQQPQQPQQIQQPQQQEQAPAPEHHNAFADGAKKFGSKLGNAAIFGAGSTLGSNLVNSIF